MSDNHLKFSGRRDTEKHLRYFAEQIIKQNDEFALLRLEISIVGVNHDKSVLNHTYAVVTEGGRNEPRILSNVQS